MAAQAGKATSLDALSERLLSATRGTGSSSILIPLTAAATAVACLGAPPDLLRPFMALLAQPGRDDPLRDLWARMADAHPYLADAVRPLIGWMDDAGPGDLDALSRCFEVLAGVDLHATVSGPQLKGDLLGPLYTALRGNGDRKALGAFFTPPAVSLAIAAIIGIGEGARVVEPSCGAGGMVIAAAAEMRSRGLDPATVTWVLNDLDPVVLALCGVNVAAHGLGDRVVLSRGDGLLLGTGLPGDGLREHTQQPRRHHPAGRVGSPAGG